MRTVFLRALEAEDKAAALRMAIREPAAAQGKQRFEMDVASFRTVPRSPFAYWVKDGLRRIFSEAAPFEADGRTARVGASTKDDFRFLRLAWECPASDFTVWVTYIKGGVFAPYYQNNAWRIRWSDGGRELKAFADVRTTELFGRPGWSRWINSVSFYFRPGLTWPLRGIDFSAQAVPSGCIFGVAGKMAFAEKGDLVWLLALFNSSLFNQLIAFFAGKIGGVQYEVGLIQSIPIAQVTEADQSTLATLACRAWSLKRSLDTCIEASDVFWLPALLRVDGNTFAARTDTWAERVRAIKAELATIQAKVDERCFDLYGIDESDRRTITEGLSFGVVEPSEADLGPDEEGENESSYDVAGLAAELVSWAVGVAFGRFDVRLATDDRPLPDDPEPFDPLPVCSPAMLTGDGGLPLASAPAGYPMDSPENGILVDDPGHPHDLTTAVQTVFEVIFGDRAEGMLREAAALLDPKGHDLRAWLTSDFFEHHLKCYSKSRRKAPILWQLGVPSGRFSVWVYAHRLARDSFFQIRRDVVEPKLLYEERQLTNLMDDAGVGPPAKQRREIAVQEAFIEELRIMLAEVKRVAPEWNPTLDDGVVLTMAPLWRLVPQHKAWQRELKSKWEELADGRYDWAHIAMHHWPERVTAKCATDPSLAIAHGLSR